MPNRKREIPTTPASKVPTIKQVAERAGVSVATVSRVLAGKGFTSPERVERVRAAVQTLDYRPNRAARNLRTRVTQVVGVVISDIQNPFFTSVVRGIEKVLEGAGYTLILCNSDEEPHREQVLLATLRAESVAGVIISPTRADSEAVHQMVLNGTPLVTIDRTLSMTSVDSVAVANTQGAFTAVNHLLKLGHKCIGMISGPDQASTAKERKDGYLQALQAALLQPCTGMIQYGNFRQEGGYHAMNALLDLPQPPTAVLVGNNLMTLGALQAIHERSLAIPQDIAIVGFDDMSWATSLQPPLTAVAQPTYELGVTAAELLLERIHDPQRPVRHIILETRLIVRASSTGQFNPVPPQKG